MDIELEIAKLQAAKDAIVEYRYELQKRHQNTMSADEERVFNRACLIGIALEMRYEKKLETLKKEKEIGKN